MYGRTDRYTDVQCETIIPRHYREMEYKNVFFIIIFFRAYMGMIVDGTGLIEQSIQFQL